jgi:hypothetical protein
VIFFLRLEVANHFEIKFRRAPNAPWGSSPSSDIEISFSAEPSKNFDEIAEIHEIILNPHRFNDLP